MSRIRLLRLSPFSIDESVDLRWQRATDLRILPSVYFNADVADEDAARIGVQYAFFKQRRTVASPEFESMHRYVRTSWNSRTNGNVWEAGLRSPGNRASDSFSIGWAAAFRAPGDPGQHNDSFVLAPM
jgi:hypothetical protein